jgi:hypothetical protein
VPNPFLDSSVRLRGGSVHPRWKVSTGGACHQIKLFNAAVFAYFDCLVGFCFIRI